MVTPPLMPLIVSSKRWLKVAAIVLPCLCLCGFLLLRSLAFLGDDDCMDEEAVAQWTHLRDAVVSQDALQAKLLLKQGGYANYDYDMPGGSRSLLMIAAEQGDLPTVKVLLHAGADVNYSGDGETAFSLAKKNHHTEVAECLRQAELRAANKLINSKLNRVDCLNWNSEVFGPKELR